MGLAKRVRRDPETAAELARCVQEGRPYRLLDLKLYLTRRCNLRCQMCNAWAHKGDVRNELSTDEVSSLIAQATSLGLVNLKLFGGEPLLRRDAEAIIAHAAGLGVRCTLITNGTVLDEPRAEALVEAGLAQLDLSLDAGDPAVHDQIRGVPGAWSRTVQGLQAIREAARRLNRPVVVRTNTVVMRQNCDSLPTLVRLLVGLGVDEIVLSPAVAQEPNSRAASSLYMLAKEDIGRYNDEIAPSIAASASGHRLAKNRELLHLYGTTGQDAENAACGCYVERLRVGCCFKPFYYAIVRESGDLVGCNTVKHPAARIGNVRTEPLEQLWHSARYREFRMNCRPMQYDDCRRCCYHTALLNRQIEEALPAGPRTPAGVCAAHGAN